MLDCLLQVFDIKQISMTQKAKPDGLAHLNGGAFGEIIIKCHQNIVFPSIPGCTIKVCLVIIGLSRYFDKYNT